MAGCNVVTWQAPNGETIHVCPACEKRLTEAKQWPKDRHGQEYCTINHGLHYRQAGCDVCRPRDARPRTRAESERQRKLNNDLGPIS
jgi:hypothetical protein